MSNFFLGFFAMANLRVVAILDAMPVKAIILKPNIITDASDVMLAFETMRHWKFQRARPVGNHWLLVISFCEIQDNFALFVHFLCVPRSATIITNLFTSPQSGIASPAAGLNWLGLFAIGASKIRFIHAINLTELGK